MQLLPQGKTYNFMGWRRIFAVASALLVVASLVGTFIWPLPRLGTDFKGGTELEVAFKQQVTAAQLREVVSDAGFSSPDVVKVADPNNPHRFMIRVQEVSTIDEAQQLEIEKRLCLGEESKCPEEKRASEVKFSPGGDKITIRFREKPDLAWVKAQLTGLKGIALRSGDNPSVQNAKQHRVEVQLKSKGDQLMDALSAKLGAAVPAAPLRSEWIGPKAGAQLRDDALKAIAIALVFVMAYIAFRFDLRFAPGAVLALVHDAVVTIGCLIALGQELNLTTVAAVLTIVGYSVNDTVVVYDRVRENLGKLRGSTFPHIINVSLSEMLSRTLLTSGTTIFSLLAFFIWGTGSIKEFSLTLIIGMVLGTYSSIYIALPLTWWFDTKMFTKATKRTAIASGEAKRKKSSEDSGEPAEATS